MDKIKITLIKVGYIDHLINFKKIQKWKSKLFEITDVQCIEHLPNSDIIDGYLDQKFTKESLGKLINKSKNANITVAITSCRFIDEWYMHLIGDNCIGLSIYGINKILDNKNIPIETFIIKELYFINTLYLLGVIDESAIFDIVHRDMRCCLFDFNGDRTEILYNTEKPKICDSCKNILKQKQFQQNTINILEKELNKIQRPFVLRIERYIKKHPFISMIISAFIAIGISAIFELIWKLIKFLLEQ